MRVLISGSRNWHDALAVRRRIELLPRDAELVVGGARGADRIAESIGRMLGMRVTVVRPVWRPGGVYNPLAGFERNSRMLGMGIDLVLAFWDGKSNGTKDTIDKATKAGIPTEILYPRRDYPGGRVHEDESLDMRKVRGV